MAVANAVAYYNTAKITAIKSFIVQAPGLEKKLWVESFALCFNGSN
jgi:hypothetical protein